MKSAVFGCILAFSGVCGLFLGGCREDPGRQNQTQVAVTNSYLGCAVRDVCGREMDVLCLAPPGMCPGHFDISPSQVERLSDCVVLLLFDFQEQVEQKLARLKEEEGLKTALVHPPGGLCVPQTYLDICRQVCDIFASGHPEAAGQYRQRLALVQERIKRLEMELSEKVRRGELSSVRIAASSHQADFLKWLGLETIATFIGSDVETAAGVERCLKEAEGQNVRFVVANKQEGSRLAKAIAERLGAEAVVFSNFPERCDSSSGFDELLRANVKHLLEAAKQ
ncbi:MAG: zinc ABC transporter substrate-binding protein [Sedimentisphaerales bacterium]|nr:zinc ABC transporter substrate-binding protein [Sedimentisphaerales bacterium]